LTVIQEYDRFLTYIIDKDLENVTDMKPIVNGGEIMQHLGVPKGPWMSKALDMVMKWQLLHPEITAKEKVLEELSNRREELGLKSK
jgi:tRNA nucleotidyltransferase/poly(A) polymerase